MAKWWQLTAVALLLAAGCGHSTGPNRMNESYEWLPSETAPRDYPVFVVAGLVTAQGGQIVLVPDSRMANNGWGRMGSIQLIEPLVKPVPVEVNIKWFGLVERQGWHGRFHLPAETILPWLRAGTSMPDGRKQPFKTLLFGMAPGGDVAVWLVAGQVVRVIGVYRAQPEQIALKDMSNDPGATEVSFAETLLSAALPAEELERVRGAPVPFGRWREYAARFAWQPQVEVTGTGDLLWVTGLDGERDWVDISRQRPVHSSAAAGAHAAPQRLEIEWTAPSGARMLGEATLDPDEALNAFHKLAAHADGAPLVLFVHPADVGRHVEVLLRAGQEIYRFTRVVSEVRPR